METLPSCTARRRRLFGAGARKQSVPGSDKVTPHRATFAALYGHGSDFARNAGLWSSMRCDCMRIAQWCFPSRRQQAGTCSGRRAKATGARIPVHKKTNTTRAVSFSNRVPSCSWTFSWGLLASQISHPLGLTRALNPERNTLAATIQGTRAGDQHRDEGQFFRHLDLTVREAAPFSPVSSRPLHPTTP
jgi:hypothetical protein